MLRNVGIELLLLSCDSLSLLAIGGWSRRRMFALKTSSEVTTPHSAAVMSYVCDGKSAALSLTIA